MIRETLSGYAQTEIPACGVVFGNLDDEYLSYSVDTYSSNLLQQLLVRRNHLFLLCKQLFDGSFINLVEFSAETYTSLSTMYRKLPQLKRLLRDYGIQIDLTNSVLIGEEKQIRHFYFELFYLAYGLTEGYSLNEPPTSCSSFQKLAFPVVQKIKLLTFITTTRQQCQQHIEALGDAFISYDKVIDREFVSHHLNNVLPTTLTEAQRNNEIEFFLIYIVTIDMISIDRFENLDIEQFYNESCHFHLARGWILKFVDYFEIELSAKSFFFLNINLYYHFTRKHTLAGKSGNASEMVDGITIRAAEHEVFWETSRTFLESIQETFPDSITSRHFYLMLIREVLLHSYKKVNICVLSGIAHAHKKQVETEIARFSVVPLRFQKKINHETDFIISDYYFEMTELTQEKDISPIFIKTYPSIQEYLLISKKILMTCTGASQ